MRIPIRTCLWGLAAIILLAGWQGFNASSAFTDSDPSRVSGLRAETPAPGNLPTQPVRPEGDHGSAATGTPAAPVQTITARAAAVDERWWPLERIGALPLPAAPEAGARVLVAVLDTGIDGRHEDLAGKVAGEISFIEGESSNDAYGHGTSVAGIIAADADEGSGIAGLAPDSRLLNVKVADDQGRARDTDVAEGIVWAVDHGAQVINISIELTGSTSRLSEAVDYAWSRGAVVVAAAGNDGGTQPVYPAAYEDCLSVTAIRENGELAPLANHGGWVDVAAPGFDIYTTLPGDSFGYKHGTSFAAAYVSGLAARLFPVVSDVNGDGNLNDEVLQAIYAAARDTGIPGTGRGLIDVAGSLGWGESLAK